jgi:GTP-binding protein
MFVDEATIHVFSGPGGNGSSSFHHEPYKPQGGPDGGDGGDGGSVILRAETSAATLLEVKKHPHIRAERGGHGAGKRRKGPRGRDRVVAVPAGTVVMDVDDGLVVADLVAAGDEVVVARGGRGGRGNARFATSTHRAPRHAERGMPGEDRRLHLELRLLADVGLVGWPNAGKSTLISRLSSARPKIASYPFTTTVPNLGVVGGGDDAYVIADIPGLIPGAHEGKGLGYRFLRHIRRTAVLVYVVDLAAQDRDPLSDVEALQRELAAFDAGLAHRPCVVVVNKIDIAREEIRRAIARWPDAQPISALTGEGMEQLGHVLKSAVERERAAREEQVSYVRHVVRPRPLSVEREENAWRVRGDRPERAVISSDLDNQESVARLQRRLIAMGVERALEDAGARAGDEVRIAEAAFEFEPGEGGGQG